MSPDKSNAGINYPAVPRRRFVPKILHCRIPSGSVVFCGVLACLFCFSSLSAAQDDRPEITPLERKLQKKKDTGPRAVGLLQMSDKGKSSLVPIAILIEGRFWDASSYKADPVPMALDSGTIYEAEESGNSLGLFTVGSALHSNAVNAPTPWLGTGTWRANGTEAPTKGLKAAIVPVGMEDTDAPPRLSRESSRKNSSAAPNSSTAPTSTSAPASAQPPSKPASSGDSDEPPRLTKSTPPPSTDPNATQPTPSSPQTAPDTSKPADSKPADTKPAQTNPDTQRKIPASDSGTPEANRPILRRGKPAESFADEDVPGYSKPGRSPSAAAAERVVDPAAPLSDVKLIPAISDASGPPPHSYAFEWLKGEENDRQKQIMQMAKDQLRAYLTTLKRETIAPKSAHSTAARPRASKPPEPIFERVKMVAYDLWNSNVPIIVFSATAHLPPSTTHSEAESNQQYSILLVAYPDIYQNLHKLYAGVTDRFHLDVTPRLDLVDAVDADGDGQGELLFRETSDSGTGWIIYRATADKLWKMYDSLSLQ